MDFINSIADGKQEQFPRAGKGPPPLLPQTESPTSYMAQFKASSSMNLSI